MNHSLGRNFEAMDPLEWLARISDHIPDPGQHRTLFYGDYSSRVRGTLSAEVTQAASAGKIIAVVVSPRIRSGGFVAVDRDPLPLGHAVTSGGARILPRAARRSPRGRTGRK